MLKQMSEKGADSRKGWASSRSSSGEGPDEVCSIDTPQLGAKGEQTFSPSYDTSSISSVGRIPPANNQQQKQDRFGFAGTDNVTCCQESNQASTCSETTQQHQQDQPQYQSQDKQYQSNELESSESRKLVAEADDLKSKLRELNIGSLDFGQDG